MASRLEPRGAASAFEILRRELETAKSSLSQAGQQAFAAADHKQAAAVADHLARLTKLGADLQALRSKWLKLMTDRHPPRMTTERLSRRRIGERQRLQPGLRTPETAYRLPILEAVVELGGSARVEDVQALLRRKLDGVLNSYDLAPLNADPRTPRWWNAAMWCRLELVKEGLLERDSPKGIWQITEGGRRALTGRGADNSRTGTSANVG